MAVVEEQNNPQAHEESVAKPQDQGYPTVVSHQKTDKHKIGLIERVYELEKEIEAKHVLMQQISETIEGLKLQLQESDNKILEQNDRFETQLKHLDEKLNGIIQQIEELRDIVDRGADEYFRQFDQLFKCLGNLELAIFGEKECENMANDSRRGD